MKSFIKIIERTGLFLLPTLFFAHAVAWAETNTIRAISANSVLDNKVVLKITMAHPLSAPPAAFTIISPARIAFDFPDTENGLNKSSQEIAEGDLRNVNIIQAGQRTRVVLNLNQMVGYESQIKGNDLLITLQNKAPVLTPASQTKTERFAEARPGEIKASVRDIDFHRGSNGEGRIQVDLSSSDVGIDIKQQGKALQIDFQKTHLPPNLRRKLDVTDFGTPVQMVDAFSQGDNVRLLVEPKGTWEYAAYQTDNKFIIEVKRVIEDPNKLVKGSQGGYSGEKLTLNFQNIETRDILNVIADFTGFNMVISDSVSGSLTLRLKDVPWDQALDIILDSKGLDRRKNGNVIQVAPRDEIAAKEKSALSANQEISDLEVTRTETFQLNYAKAADLEKLLSNEKQRILSKRGSVVIDIRTNSIFVQDTPSRLEDVRKLIKKIDVPVKQVLIEARFIEAGESFTRILGGRLGISGTGTLTGGSNLGITGNGNVNLPVTAQSGTTAGGFTLSIFDALSSRTLAMELNAANLDGTTKYIASPRIVTGDNMLATIKSGVKFPYLKVNPITGVGTPEFLEAVLKLSVTPQITPEGPVSMLIDVSWDTMGALYSGIPSVNTKSVITQALVDNGGTVGIGGVYTQDESDAKQQVPLLGDIPFFGWLFKSDSKIKNKKELLIFITPKVLKDSMSVN